MILDAITSSPINVLFSIVIGIGLVYLFCKKPSSSSSSSSTSSHLNSSTSRVAFLNNSAARSAALGNLGPGVIDEDLQRVVAQLERQERDMIRQEQDAAYQQSLKADREKQLKREEELKRKQEEERSEKERKERQEKLHNSLVRLKSEIKGKLPSPPTNKEIDSSNNIVKLVFKLPDGSRVQRCYRKNDRVKYLYWFIFSLDEAPLQFRLTTNFPKRELPGRPPIPQDFDMKTHEKDSSSDPNCEQTLEEAGLIETQIIFVYDLEA